MGANFITKELDGELSTQDVLEKFHDMSADAGSWNMLHGLEFHINTVFANREVARDYIEGNADKWGDGLAVRFLHRTPGVATVERWLIGGWASS